MRIGIDMGHTLNPANYGAIGIKNESEETRAVGKKLIGYLECMGNKVVDVTVDYANSKSESLRERVAKANAQPLDFFVSLHFNAFDGKRNGSEIYTYRGKRLPQAVRVLDNLSKLGFKNNGIFDGSKLYVIKKTKAPAMLVEIAYIDSPIDMKIYNDDLVARAIAEGITGQKIPQKCLRINEDDKIVEQDDIERCDCGNGIYRVVVGGAQSYESAVKCAWGLKELGYIVAMEKIEEI
ncbi:MAG: N-acetylmuramoyl-L-alanine amidase [Clostridium sp.]